MENLISYLQAESQKWPGVKTSYRKSWECEYFEVIDKFFCMIGETKTGDVVMTVKGDPEKNEELREQYHFIVPGYYTNKTHWNSIMLAQSTFGKEELLAYLRRSYELVFAKLPEKVQKSLLESS
ncbi:MmcQ/YjbR family DNA-binding protein [uncultured Vagococcus sp.]|uniref:MmcQ/YjbR family DNA-binding protein n=1 Tax=uncultured Vagococcus sp. TaxID=189676 RepID=UPI0028D5A203|nr:MmcQ/YjbR family DNA-binding protein [uncultured Vagococcus sp.]